MMAVLILDDCKSVDALQKVVSKNTEFEIKLALDGDHAMEVIERGGIELFVADLCMEADNCKMLLQRINKLDPQLPTIAVINLEEDVGSDYQLGRHELDELGELIVLLASQKGIVAYHAAFKIIGDDTILVVDLDSWFPDEEIKEKLADAFSVQTARELKDELENPSVQKIPETQSNILNVEFKKHSGEQPSSKLGLDQKLR